MNELFTVLAVVAVVAMVISRQLRGEPLRGKRVVLLPVILIVVGLVGLHGTKHLATVDVVCMAASALVAVAIGVVQGAVMHLESRDGGLWGRMPVRGLWLWAALIASRVVITIAALALGTKTVTSTDSILLILGVNRLAQAAVIAARAVAAGVPFSPEKDGKTFLPGLLGHPASSAPTPDVTASPSSLNVPTWSALARHVTGRLESTP